MCSTSFISTVLTFVTYLQQRMRPPTSKFMYNGRGRDLPVNNNSLSVSSGITSPPPSVASVQPSNPAELSSMLANASPQQQKQMLGERLFPLVQQLQVPFMFYLDSIYTTGHVSVMVLNIETSFSFSYSPK